MKGMTTAFNLFTALHGQRTPGTINAADNLKEFLILRMMI